MGWWWHRKKKTQDGENEASFGLFDGLVSVIGVIVGLMAGPAKLIVRAAVGLAAASTVSMAMGEWLGDAKRSWKRALVMGAATLIGTLLPIGPFLFFSKMTAVITSSVITLGTAAYIAEQRTTTERRLKAYLETYLILIVSIGLTILVTYLTG